ncbi:MAG: hypothetical protein UY13_C0002G0447 [Candidatus Pacebacteria bacterium GW2011_GWB1_47_8]|nr:MAG: hypothetical protein UX28_C0002G0006 [Candidatus Pacebacteria bacterium GW2011_GWA1_46_10]KKU84535.1 MAG: hypothetical protein UY13_C0002G0447 [Candidatus Pacebacteria bacterium GW2011_GWB1_47_8]HCR81685.1 hypothetical protein [Candidatus Paceibacterota bacterium]
MARLNTPEGYKPSGRSEEKIRERINQIPIMSLTSPNFSSESKNDLRLKWWEEIALKQKDLDEAEAYEENNRRNQTAA